MTKMVGVAVFKATCLKLIDEMQTTGESITVTKRGKIVAIMQPATQPERSVIGLMRSNAYRFDVDPSEPAVDPEDWDALR